MDLFFKKVPGKVEKALVEAFGSVDKALEYAESRSNNRQIVVLDTDQYKLRGGQSGQWAVGVQGLASMNEASAACRAMGLTPGSQCGRFQVS